MSIECYYTWCKYHPKDEPFCHEEYCRASVKELQKFSEEYRQSFLKTGKTPEHEYETS